LQINSNISALNSQRMLNRADGVLERSLHRLSSGLRVNTARDDAAGLAISERMTSQIRGNGQALRNANDAISMLQTGEGALSEVANLLQRGRELALQAANGTYGTKERQSLQAEIAQLSAEVDRIGRETDFNGVKILGGGYGGTAIVSGGPDPLASRKLEIVDALKRSWLAQGEQMFLSPIAQQAFGNDIARGFDAMILQPGQRLRIAFTAEDGLEDGQPGDASDIADDVLQLNVHLREGFVQVVHATGCSVQEAITMAQDGAHGGILHGVLGSEGFADLLGTGGAVRPDEPHHQHFEFAKSFGPGSQKSVTHCTATSCNLHAYFCQELFLKVVYFSPLPWRTG
jgi:hypothetical protein